MTQDGLSPRGPVPEGAPAEFAQSLDEVRARIDQLDAQMLALMAQRAGWVRQAARFKRSVAEVPAPQRVAQVVARVRAQAQALGLSPEVAEATWRAMIGAFIEEEARLVAHRTATSTTESP